MTRSLRFTRLACLGVFSGLGAFFTLCCATPAVAAEPDACIEGYEKSQELRKDDRLIDARGALATCIRPGCPQVLQRQCSRWLEEVERAQPSVVLKATVNGEDAGQVDVEMDGLPLNGSLDGKSIDVDPGPHTFHFRLGTEAPIDKRVVIREGEKLRAVSVAFVTQPVAATTDAVAVAIEPAAPATEPVASDSDVRPARSVPTAVYVLGGVALVSAGVATYFGLSGLAEEQRLQRECAPVCASSRVDVASHRYTVADIAIGVSAASLISGAVLYLLQQRPAPSASSARVGLWTSPGLAKASFSMNF